MDHHKDCGHEDCAAYREKRLELHEVVVGIVTALSEVGLTSKALNGSDHARVMVLRQVLGREFYTTNDGVCRGCNRSDCALGMQTLPQVAHDLNEKILRRFDGDLCQLCLKPINFRFRSPNPWSAAVDHVIPQRHGGSNEIENLWLAHRICNSRKSAHYTGRADGSTDVRRAAPEPLTIRTSDGLTDHETIVMMRDAFGADFFTDAKGQCLECGTYCS